MNLTDVLIAFFMSMLPIIELRGGIIYAAARGVPFILAFIVCYIGNILPVPFILIFLRKIFNLMRRFKYTRRIVEWLEKVARSKEGRIQKYSLLGLFIISMLPLPGMGTWTGALVAVVLDIQIKKSFPVIALGALVAGIIMSVLSFAIPGLFFPKT